MRVTAGEEWRGRRNESPQREKAFLIQMTINSESYHRVNEEPLGDNAQRAMRVDMDRWGSTEGSEQKMEDYHQRSNRVRNDDAALNN